jgi:programmed cell death protein 5
MSFPEPNDLPQDNSVNHEQAAQKEQILKQILTPEARMRLNNIKMVKPELSDLVEQYLIGMATQGKMHGQINDDQLKQILLSTQQPKRDFKINRV